MIDVSGEEDAASARLKLNVPFPFSTVLIIVRLAGGGGVTETHGAFHTTIEVPGHPVRRADVEIRRTVVREIPEP